MKNYNNAIKYYNNAINLNPKQYEIFYRLANLYNEIDKYEDAKSASKKCLNIKRNYSPAYFELGIAEKALGNKIAAIDAFENAKKNKDCVIEGRDASTKIIPNSDVKFHESVALTKNQFSDNGSKLSMLKLYNVVSLFSIISTVSIVDQS